MGFHHVSLHFSFTLSESVTHQTDSSSEHWEIEGRCWWGLLFNLTEISECQVVVLLLQRKEVRKSSGRVLKSFLGPRTNLQLFGNLVSIKVLKSWISSLSRAEECLHMVLLISGGSWPGVKKTYCWFFARDIVSELLIVLRYVLESCFHADKEGSALLLEVSGIDNWH